MAGIILPAHVNLGRGDVRDFLVGWLRWREGNGDASAIGVSGIPGGVVGPQPIVERTARRQSGGGVGK